ncbi:hypothetical protein PT974_09981 [Cladobotryum mycophilum]|uniref:TIL domain-containing protein n=1 Tax=Cladobotryum mycophilum TaxID=491253 RepID=A0ABR0S8R8_9HYPO
MPSPTALPLFSLIWVFLGLPLELEYPVDCPSNLVYSECVERIESCIGPLEDLHGHCLGGCVCDVGYIFDPIRSHECILPQDCPTTIYDRINRSSHHADILSDVLDLLRAKGSEADGNSRST